MNPICKEVERVLICGLGSIGKAFKSYKRILALCKSFIIKIKKFEFYKNKESEIEGI